jgi:threonylcarbamoyladenosine tRNA methylthiotransferase MtaB
MGRKTTPEGFARLLDTAYSQIPGLAVTTDIITGFPGETETEFAESLDFVRRMRFAGGHIFTFSERPGTAAARMAEQVPHPIRKSRNTAMRAVFSQSSAAYQRRFLGQQLEVLWETATQNSIDSWQVSGLTDNYLRVVAHSSQRIWNQITPVQLTGLGDGGMVGKIIG